MSRIWIALLCLPCLAWNPLRAGDDPDAAILRFSANFTAPIHVHTQGYDELPLAEVRGAIEAAMDTWGVNRSTFRFSRALNGRDGDTPAVDGYNVVRFETRQLPREVDPNSVLAFTSPVSAVCSGILIEADITFNAVTVRWSTADRSRRSDIETVALHELGHFLGLDHSDDRDAVMFPSIQERVRRDLHADDLAGVRAIYPPGRGEPCGRDGDCGGGEVCVFNLDSDSDLTTYCAPPLGGARPGQRCDAEADGCDNGCANGLCFGDGTCSAVCAGDDDCPAGRSCIPQNVGDGVVVPFCIELNLCEDDIGGCPRGEACVVVAHPTEDRPLRICTDAGPRALGQPCERADQCAGALCSRGTCSQLCDDECPAPFACEQREIQLDINQVADIGLCALPDVPCIRPRDCEEGFGCAYVNTVAGPESRCLPTEAAPAGEPCDANEACRSGICLADGQCSDACRNEADCPLHMTCGRAAVGGVPVPACVPLPPDAGPPRPADDVGVDDAAMADARVAAPRDGGAGATDAARAAGDGAQGQGGEGGGGIVVRRSTGDGGDSGCSAAGGAGPWWLGALLLGIRRRR